MNFLKKLKTGPYSRRYEVLLLVLLFVLRLAFLFWQGVPSLNQDEAALLMNARFVTQSGIDEWGETWPVVFRSFGDFKLPGYIYATGALGSLIGWSWWVVRLPSLVAGVLLVPAVFLLTKDWFGSRVAWWTSLLLVVSPWSWHYGTVGFEANAGLSLFIWAWWLLTHGRFQTWRFILGLWVYLIAMLTYNSPLLLFPLLLAALLWRWGWSQRSWRFAAVSIVGTLAMVVVAALLTFPATAQKTGISIFSDPQLILDYAKFRHSFPGIWQTILGNRWLYYLVLMLQRWLWSWDPRFLIGEGGANPWHTIPGQGHIPLLLWLLVPVGIVQALLAAWKKRTAQELLPFVVLLGSLAPAVITVDAPHATRSLFFFVLLTVWAGVGLVSVKKTLRGWQPKPQWLLGALLVLSFLWWWVPARQLWRTHAHERWPIGLWEQLAQLPENNKTVYIRDDHGTLYTFMVNARQMPAEEFVQSVQRSKPDTAGLQRVEKVGRYQFVFSLPEGANQGYYLFPQENQKWAMIEL